MLTRTLEFLPLHVNETIGDIITEKYLVSLCT